MQRLIRFLHYWLNALWFLKKWKISKMADWGALGQAFQAWHLIPVLVKYPILKKTFAQMIEDLLLCNFLQKKRGDLLLFLYIRKLDLEYICVSFSSFSLSPLDWVRLLVDWISKRSGQCLFECLSYDRAGNVISERTPCPSHSLFSLGSGRK